MRSNSFFNKSSLAALVLMAFSSSLLAQNMTTNPSPSGLGLTIGGWSQSAGVATGNVTGGDGKGVISTLTDGGIRLSVESFLTGNNNPNCQIDCSDSQSKLSIIGSMLAGGTSSNQGVGPGAVTAQFATNNMMMGSVYMDWRPTPAPAAAPVAQPAGR